MAKTKQTGSGRLDPHRDPDAAPPTPVDDAQPLAIYLIWLVVGAILVGGALAYPLRFGISELSRLLPSGEHVAAAGAIGAWLLAIVELCGRHRPSVGMALHAIAGVLLVLAIEGHALAAVPVELAWTALVVALGYGACHLLLFDAWLAGRRSPQLRTASATAADLATARWWVWASKAALARRTRRLEDRARLERAASERRIHEHAAEQKQAEQRVAQAQLETAEIQERTALADHQAAREREKADRAIAEAAVQERTRLEAEQQLKRSQCERSELASRAETALIERTRLRAEQLDANRACLEAALSARAVAESAIERRLEAEQAAELLREAQAELDRLSSEPDLDTLTALRESRSSGESSRPAGA